MAERFDMSHQESVADTQPNLSQLKKEVEITPSTLKDITGREQFLGRVVELSTNAKDSINIQRAKQALVYLTEAEKILQYAASCGKTIDKYIIISVLHNQACCYQKIWELQKCSQYLEALIFNFNSFMKTSQLQDSSKNRGKRSQDRFSSDSIDCKTFLAKYYLQFCAVNSQTDNHSGALVAGKKSIEILKSIFREMAELVPSLKKGTYQKKAQFQYKLKLIDLASRLNDSLNVNNYDILFQAAKYYLRQWKVLKDSKDRPDRNYILEQEFKNYSIGNAMQIVAMDYKQFQQKQPKNYSAKTVLQKILLMALGYFTISTELRLIATKKYGKRDSQKANSNQYKESQIYHLLSIIIASACIPFEILYIKHVLSSYSNHYGNDLLVAEQESRLKDNFQELLFVPLSKIRKQTINNSFQASIDQEETISKFEKEETLQHSSQQDIPGERRREDFSRMEEPRNQLAKKVKHSHKLKSKSKSKQNLKSIHILGNQRSEKAFPMPKSPNAHMRSPKNNLIKVKTSYKLKVSAEKIVTTNNMVKEDKSRKKRQPKNQNGDFDYFIGRSKDLKKMKKTVEAGMNLPSPRPNSRSSSRRESPVPRYFDYTKSPQQSMKCIKSPKKSTGPSKNIKQNLHQHYL